MKSFQYGYNYLSDFKDKINISIIIIYPTLLFY